MLSIIIVNYKSENLISECLRSIYEYPGTYEIIVVDNCFNESASKLLLLEFPGIRWIDMKYNAGFARANNRGIQEAKGEEILLLNPDTLVIDDAINRCLNLFKNSKYVACGVQLLNEDGTPQVSGNFAMLGGLNYLMMIPYVGKLIRFTGLKTGIKKPNIKEANYETCEVDWINGAFLMVKRSAAVSTGAFDEDFFLYHEESEWCSRLKKVGKLVIFGQLQVYHFEGRSSNQAFNSNSIGHSDLSDRKGYQLLLSLFVRIRKEFGILWLIFHLLFHLLAIPFIIICLLVDLVARSKLMRQQIKVVAGYIINYIKCCSFVPHIVIDKPFFYKVL